MSGGPTVYVNIGNPTYHELRGCYGAETPIDWHAAVDAGGTPCGRCCVSFELVEA